MGTSLPGHCRPLLPSDTSESVMSRMLRATVRSCPRTAVPNMLRMGWASSRPFCLHVEPSLHCKHPSTSMHVHSSTAPCSLQLIPSERPTSVRVCGPPETMRTSPSSLALCAAKSRHSICRTSAEAYTCHSPASRCGLRRCSSSIELRKAFTTRKSALVRGLLRGSHKVRCHKRKARTSKSPGARVRDGAAKATNLASNGTPADKSQSRALRPPSSAGKTVVPRRKTNLRPPLL
mmetsp:Transcript_73279/g.138467  ORF Transcript_73279/g.138467 Transcript_73279/m.138467 type:complete len:234 (-) Transcript_73279:1315-2016(-)